LVAVAVVAMMQLETQVDQVVAQVVNGQVQQQELQGKEALAVSPTVLGQVWLLVVAVLAELVAMFKVQHALVMVELESALH
jgi:fumarate reductase subunit D